MHNLWRQINLQLRQFTTSRIAVNAIKSVVTLQRVSNYSPPTGHARHSSAQRKAINYKKGVIEAAENGTIIHFSKQLQAADRWLNRRRGWLRITAYQGAWSVRRRHNGVHGGVETGAGCELPNEFHIEHFN